MQFTIIDEMAGKARNVTRGKQPGLVHFQQLIDPAKMNQKSRKPATRFQSSDRKICADHRRLSSTLSRDLRADLSPICERSGNLLCAFSAIKLPPSRQAMSGEPKVPKFKRCKISRQQLMILMQHFGTPRAR